uniref:Uncharacterized protein n=1 Tax=Meloidogyne enterolobii TaxID=390850 RepID=A0A6V7UMV6_MELEN|nr:unnamed protein product [Meloidogyne enterolobii]
MEIRSSIERKYTSIFLLKPSYRLFFFSITFTTKRSFISTFF